MNVFSKYWDLIYRGLVLLVLGAFWVGYSKSSYATREDVTAIVAPVASRVDTLGVQLSGLDKALAVLIEQGKVNARQDDQIRDLELRLRQVEHLGR